MQQYTGKGAVEVSPDENLTDALWAAAKTHPDRPAVAHRVGDRFVEWTTAKFVEQVRSVAKGLMASGVEAGDRVALYSGTRVEWTVLDFAIWAAGAVTVPIYETSSSDQIRWIVTDADVSLVLVESADLVSVYNEVSGSLTGVKEALVIEDDALGTLAQRGESVSDPALYERADAVTGADIATIVYTSGTTGRPKGCVITHHNFVWECSQVIEAERIFVSPGRRTLLFLPLAHIFARVIQTACVRQGVVLGFSTGVPQLVEELGIFKPHFLLAVPRVFEKVYNGARAKAQEDGKEAIFDRAATIAETYSRQSETGKVTLGVKLQHKLFDKLLYAKIRERMGGEVRHAVSGGAALGERIGHFFNGIGVQVLEGYGLTETTAGTCLAQPEAMRIGTVGPPVPGVTVAIADDGELLFKGGHIFAGYHNNAAATAEVVDEDGWFHSGDLGQLDADGFVRITGRKKEILVTAGGKNVAPAVLEDRMRAHALVSQSMVVGDGEPFIGALITIDPEAFERWTEKNNKSGKTVADLTDDPVLVAEVQQAIDEANSMVSKAESIRAFRILPEDFEIGVELSQKMSVKRHVVSEKYAGVINDIYQPK